MANCVHRSSYLFFFVCFWLLVSLVPVYGGGRMDNDLSRADTLINEKRFDEAIQILSDYARRNPERFEQSQQRLQRIFSIREEFNRTADELIYTLLNDPDNSEKIYELILRLRSLEDDTSPVFTSFISRTQEIAQFNVYRNRLRNILEGGRALLDRGDCGAALQTYAGGMNLMKDEFFTAGYGETIENQVMQETERVNSVLASFRAESSRLGTISADLVRFLNAGDLAGVREAITRLMPAMDRFIELKQELYTSVNIFDQILDELYIINSEMGDRNHLSFFSRVIHGRADEAIQEGMLGAFDTYWNNSIGSVLNAITLNVERANTAGLAAFNAGNYQNAITAFQRLEEFTGLSTVFYEKHLALNEGGRPQTVTLFGNTILQDDIPSYTTLINLSEAGNSLRQTAVAAGRMGTLTSADLSSFARWQEGSIDTVTAMNSEQQTRNFIAGIQTEIENIIARAEQTDTLTSSYRNVVYIRDALSAIEIVYAAVAAEGHQSAYRYYAIAGSDLRRSLTARSEELERGRDFLDGQTRTGTDGVIVVERYPVEALETLTAMLSALTGDLQRGNSLLANYRNEPAEVMAAGEFIALHSDSQSVVRDLNTLHAQGAALAETARSRTALSEAHRQEGERLLREAQTAYQRQSFDVARDRLQRASERFINSLEIQESASLRQSWDTQLINLGQAIATAENEMIIVEVRNLVNNARVTYFAGNFQQAEDSLVRARNRWRLTNSEENEEVLYWLGIVRGAMSARSGRIIPATAPLYPEMSQLLSEARINYEEGVRYINTGSRSQGLARFDEARRLTREVRLIFPVNQEAGILELRIEQFADPAVFNASFEQRLRNAIAGTKQRSMESFADLQNLAEINPRYPGIRGILNQAEIDMGYRPPPPNPRDLARSTELTASASRILEGNVTTLYEVALTQVNEAITLNPENIEATRVKDRLLNRMSVPGAIVLNSEDEDEYQRAVRELQVGNNLVALAVVERLIQNPRNRNITKLIELQRRIQSVL